MSLQFFPNDKLENDAFKNSIHAGVKTAYYPAHVVCRQVHISSLTLSKMTSSMMVSLGEQKTNIGLNLKFEAKQQKVLGYSERGLNGWEFSQKTIDLLREYTEKFPEVSSTFDKKKGGGAFFLTSFSFGGGADGLCPLQTSRGPPTSLNPASRTFG